MEPTPEGDRGSSIICECSMYVSAKKGHKFAAFEERARQLGLLVKKLDLDSNPSFVSPSLAGLPHAILHKVTFIHRLPSSKRRPSL